MDFNIRPELEAHVRLASLFLFAHALDKGQLSITFVRLFMIWIMPENYLDCVLTQLACAYPDLWTITFAIVCHGFIHLSEAWNLSAPYWLTTLLTLLLSTVCNDYTTSVLPIASCCLWQNRGSSVLWTFLKKNKPRSYFPFMIMCLHTLVEAYVKNYLISVFI